MENDPEDEDFDLEDVRNWLDAKHRSLAVHEAGHTIVARALGAEVVFVEIDLTTHNGESRSSEFADDPIKSLAICVAGCRAEHLLDAHSPRGVKISDFRKMREQLKRLPEADRRGARTQGYQLADDALKANKGVVCRIVDELMARRWIRADAIVRIEGDVLAALLLGCRTV